MKSKIINPIFYLLFFFLFSNAAVAYEQDLQLFIKTPKPPIKVVAYDIPDIFESNVPSVHYDLWDLISKKLDRKIDFEFYPINRANRVFKKRANACLYIASLNKFYYKNTVGIDPQNLLFSDVLTTMNLRIYSRRGLPMVTSTEQLRGKTIYFRKPVSENERRVSQVLEGANVVEVESQERVMSMLVQGRVDYGLIYDTDAEIIFKKMRIIPLLHSPELSLYELKEGLVCNNTQGNKEIISIFNELAKKVRAQGDGPFLFMPR